MGILNTISLDSLSKAYDLDINQCVNLTQCIPCWSAEGESFSAEKMSTLGKAAIIDEYILESFPNRAIDAIRSAAIIWHDGEAAASIEKGIQEYKNLIVLGREKEAIFALKFIVDTFFIEIGTFLVDKIEAVHFLDENNLVLINDVRGLTKDSVDKILASKTVARSSTPAAVVNNALESPQRAATEPTQERNQSGNIQYIQAWESILTELTGAELTAAKLAIEKWHGKSHAEAFTAVRPGEEVRDPKNYVSKMRGKAEKVALRYGLTMPPWNTIS